MVRRRYVASGQMEDGALFRLALLALVAGAVAGVVEGLVSRWFDLLLIFPLIIGLAAGFAAAKVVTSSKVRAPVLAGLLAALGGLVGQGVKGEMEYQRFRRADLIGAAEAGQPAPDVDQILLALTGKPGRAGYLLLRAEEGTTINRHGRKGPALKGTAYWVLFGVEFLAAGLTAFGIGWSGASAPFCERCKKWFGPETRIATGAGDKQSIKASLAALEASDWGRFAGGLGLATEKHASAVLVAACPGCTDSDRVLKVKFIARPGHRKESASVKFVSMIRPDELRGLETALAERHG
jgi:hypothetical protein